jgi:hypothetical protein
MVYRLLQSKDRITLDPDRLGDSALSLFPGPGDRPLRSLLTPGEPITARSDISVASLLTEFPVAVLYAADPA